MEHNELDKLFRDMIHNDDSGLNKQEQDSKKEVWDQLDLPSKAKQVSFPFWKIAAAVLFLLLGGSSWMLLNNINLQQEKYAALEEDYLQIKKSLLAVENKLNQSTPTTNDQTINVAPSEAIVQTETTTIIQKEYVDKIVPVRDTIWIEKNIESQSNIKLIRDTVYIEVAAKSPAKWTSIETKTGSSKDSITKKKGPSKVEFVFGKKELKKPEQKQKLFIIESELVKKTKTKKGIFTTPNN